MSARTLPTSGLHSDIPEAAYHGDRESLSSTGAKLLLAESPAAFRHAQTHPVHKQVYDYGHVSHSLILGRGADITVIDAPDWRTKAAREKKAVAYAEGKTPVLKGTFEQAERLAEAVHAHKLAAALLAEGEAEVSAYALDPETGVLMRGRIDWLAPTLPVDVKTSHTANPRDLTGRYGVFAKRDYDLQAAWYLTILEACGHPAAGFVWIVAESDPPHQVTVAFLDDEDLVAARGRVRRALDLYARCVETDTWPPYVPDTDAVRLSLTDMHYNTETLA